MDTQGKAVKLVNSKLAISKFSRSSNKSISVTTRSMSNKLKDSSRITPLTGYVKKDLDSPSHAMTNATTIEEQLASLTIAFKRIMKHVQEQDAQIARLINKADNADTSLQRSFEFLLTGTYGDHLVKQFVQSLKGNAFDWCTHLEASSIDRWEQLE
ncbi:UNVERIFIED_CONTAM: hypothetical protein Slati_3694500 [Sesamum latifolium]|uniref:Ty3-gypsy retrotransposon protein n=1 Tax=Sesamum latifolium TaxID=2727402 RepID=A0AAW2U3C5_9LAMI